jgi:hypothetical protein
MLSEIALAVEVNPPMQTKAAKTNISFFIRFSCVFS